MEAPRVVTFLIERPFEAALRELKRSVTLERLRMPCEVDTAARIKAELGVGLKRNVVLYVDDPVELLEATVMNPAGGLFIPEPVVLSEETKNSARISVRSLELLPGSELPASLRSAVLNLHERLLTAISRVARKQTAASEMAEHGARLTPAARPQ